MTKGQRACPQAVFAIVHDRQIRTAVGESRGGGIVVGDDLAVAVEEQHGESGWKRPMPTEVKHRTIDHNLPIQSPLRRSARRGTWKEQPLVAFRRVEQ